MGVLECPLKCGQCFPNSNDLKNHLEAHLSDVKCPFCFLIMENIHALPAHLDECLIKKEADPEEVEDDEFDTEVISVLPDDLDDEDEETSEQCINKTETNRTVTKANVDKIKTEYNGNSLQENLKVETTLLEENEPGLDPLGDAVVSQEMVSQDEEEHESQDSKDFHLSPLVQDVEQEVEADLMNATAGQEENVYHCSSCNAHFTDVNKHLTDHHSNQQVYLQLPEKEGNTLIKPDDGDQESEDEMNLTNLPSAVNDAKDQAIWVSWSGEYYLSTRNPSNRFQVRENLSYVLRPKMKNCCVEDLSPFYMEDEYGDKFFSVPVDTAIDYFEASNGRCGPKRFVGVFSRVCIGSVFKADGKGHSPPIHVYERIISTSQLSLTHILFAKMPPEHFLPIIVQINPRQGNDEGVKYKIFWKCNLCGRELDTWEHHECDDVFTEDTDATLSGYSEDVDMSENEGSVNKENADVHQQVEIEEYIVGVDDGVNKVEPVKSGVKFLKNIKPIGPGNTILKHMCKKCNIIFFKDSYFFQHVRDKHAKQTIASRDPVTRKMVKTFGKYYCESCKLVFASEKWLSNHYQQDHRHQPGYKPPPPQQQETRIDDKSDRTCVDCRVESGGIVFESRAWYKLHRKTAHGETVDESELPVIPKKPNYKKIPAPTIKTPKTGGVVKEKKIIKVEPDEVVPSEGPLEPKILRTCSQCVKVKNSIYNLRKHMREVHGDMSIVLDGESTGEQSIVDKDTEDLISAANTVSQDPDHELYEITERTVKHEKPSLYKFQQDDLPLEDVQKRYAEYNVYELDIEERTCQLCYAQVLETHNKLLKHLELKHMSSMCLESYFLMRRKLLREARKQKRRIEIFNASNLPEDVRSLISIPTDPDSAAPQALIVDMDLKTEQDETDCAIESLVAESHGEDTEDGDESQPPSKKPKYEIVKPGDLPASVRKKVEAHTGALNDMDAPVFVRSVSQPMSDKEDKSVQDRTSKLTIEVMDFLNYKEKLQARLSKKAAAPTPEGENKRPVRHSSVLDFTGDTATSCMTCRVTFTTERWLERHKEIFHKNCSECSVCSLLIQDHVMEVHMKGHNRDTSDNSLQMKAIEFTCRECNSSFASEEHLGYHRLVHQNKVMMIQKERCPYCTAEFFDPDMLKNHLKIHSDRRTYTCNYCHKHFYILAEKVCHERIHTGVKPYACEECGKAFRKKFSLTMHQRHVHLNDRRYQCDLCLARFVTNSSLIVHKQRHDNTPRFKCKLCPKMFTNTGTRANHMRRKHYGTVEYVCKHCTRIFLGMAALKKHYDKHEAQELKYPCHLCPQVYGRSLFLTKHLKEAHCEE
ncbi:hypothetical protein M8J77_012694 [Diaphorina citri]|nr:hypothetical protein M8J77_012694 [Diaphorina citri]